METNAPAAGHDAPLAHPVQQRRTDFRMSTKAPLRKLSTAAFSAAEPSAEAAPRQPPPTASGRPGAKPAGALARGRPSSEALPSIVVRRHEGELILDYPKPLEPVTALRSTLLTSSLSSLRERGLFERYDALQTSPHRDKILNTVAGEWLPLEVGLAHYRACDALGLSESEQFAIGKDVSRRIHETFLNLVVKAARGVGMTPWLLLPRGNTMNSRLCIGGGIRIWKLAEKSVRVELAQMPHLTIAYVRNGLVGLYAAAIELLADNVTTRIVRSESFDPARLLVLRIDWG